MKRMASKSLEPWNDLKNKVVLVTGSSSGLGRDFGLDLAKSGCRVLVAARRVELLKSLCDQINREYPISSSGENQPRAVAVILDISSSEQVIKNRVQEAWEVFGRIDVLINNAGVRERIHGPLDLMEKEWNDIIRTNQTGTWLLSKHISVLMRDAENGGSIINISSVSGLDRVQFHGGHAYSASKTAITAITKVMALELGPYNIRVNTIAPAIFESGITKGLVGKPWFAKVNSMANAITPGGSIVPGVTSVARYLIHDASQYVTGNTFIVDCGHTLRSAPLHSHL